MNQNSNIINLQKEETDMQFPLWNAVFAVALAVAGLITSEFLPVSLLTPMAEDIGISEGMAGQTIAVTAGVAMISSLLISSVMGTINRRKVLLAFAILQIAANLLVFFAPNFIVLLIGRFLLGLGLGGFWAMLAATAMRLVPEKDVPKALSIIYASVSLATVVAAPMGSFLGHLIGWRNVFLLASGLGLMAFIWQAFTLPSMPVEKAAKLSTLLKVIKRPVVKWGMIGTMFSFMAYATLFTYLRPFLEKVTGLDVNYLSLVLLGFGLANLLGAGIARYLLAWNLYLALAVVLFVMGISAAGLVLFGMLNPVAALLIGLWGMGLGVVQLGWTAWLTRTVPDEVESAGGLQIGIIQLAIMAGAAIGGIVFDYTSVKGVFTTSSMVAILAVLAVILTSQKSFK
ncbi:MAG: MFS transporter [Sphingobacterium sp.]|nr:MFS transporter [Sphingobacterium sp.]